jgi:hypothetical protein
MSQPPVLVLPGQAVPSAALAALGQYTKRGSTVNFDVYYDNSLGTNGQNLADAVLAKCEQDFAQLRAWFGGINAGRFAVYIDPGSFGAYHATCLATEIHCAAFSGTNGDLVNMVNVAEVDEVLMAVQNAGWDCGGSNGEGLSRVLATERYPAQLNGFATASLWLESSRPDYVSVTDPTAGLQGGDLSHVGCAALFINYLRTQLGFSLNQIVQAAGATLAQTYRGVTNRSDGFARFSNLIAEHFPPGSSGGLTTDNPFPLTQHWIPIRLAVRRGNQIIYQAQFGDTVGVMVSYGNGPSEDQYLVGDWTGDGKAKLAVRRGNQVIYQSHITDTAGTQVAYGNGNSEDQYLVGDWTGDGKAKLAVRRGNQVIYQLHIADTIGVPIFYGNGNSEDQYLVGKF